MPPAAPAVAFAEAPAASSGSALSATMERSASKRLKRSDSKFGSFKPSPGATLTALKWASKLATQTPLRSPRGGAPAHEAISDIQSRNSHFTHGGTHLFTPGSEAQGRRGSTVFFGEKLRKVGQPFSPERSNIEHLGIFQRELPRNVYAAVVLLYLNGESALDGFCRVVKSALVPVMLALLAQVTLASYLRLGVIDVQGDLAPDCKETTWWLRTVALWAFIGLCVQHMFMAVEMHLWLSLFPRARRHTHLMLQKHVSEEHVLHVVHRPATGITDCARASFYLFVLLPFFLTTCFTLWAGSGAVMRSGNDFDLVLNNVAAIFVLDLDDYAYTLLLPHTIRNATEGLPPLNRGAEEGGRLWGRFRAFTVNLYSWLTALLITAIMLPVYHGWCGFEGADSESAWF